MKKKIIIGLILLLLCIIGGPYKYNNEKAITDVCSSLRRNVVTLYHEIKKEIFNVKDMPQC